MSVPPRPERPALSRELAEFLIELSIALHKHAMYPDGHPSLAPAAAALTHRAENLLEQRATLSLGVARQQLVIEGVATDPKHPVLAELAGRLHRHHLGAITFHRGLRASEITSVLQTLAADADRSGEPLGLGPPERLRAWTNIRLYPLTYDRLELMDDRADPAGKGARNAQLWVGLARAALAAQSDDDTAAATAAPAAIAEAIDQHPKSAAYDQVIVGYLLQIADELKAAGGAEAAALRRRTSKLIGALQPATLQRLIEMGGDRAQRARFAIDATHGLAVDAVLEIVRAMADASHHSVSDPLLRLLSKLAVHAERGSPAAQPQADDALRDQVRSLLTGWTLDDPNPEAYTRALHGLTRAGAPVPAATEAHFGAEPERILQTALEVDVGGPLAERAVTRLLDTNRVGTVIEAAAEAPAGGHLANQLWPRLTAPDMVRRVVDGEAPDFAALDRLLPRLETAAFEPLLDLLAASESRAVRRGLLDRLSRAPAGVGRLVVQRLSGEVPWFVARNLLGVLDGLGTLPEGFSTAPYAAHDDPRVRRAALALALKVPADRGVALVAALHDRDGRIVHLGLTAALDGCPPVALPIVAAMARDERRHAEFRVLAIKVLGRVRAPAALQALFGLVDGGRTLFRRGKLQPKSPALLAALTALARSHTMDPRARRLLAIAARSKDPEIRHAATPDAEPAVS